MMKTVLETVRMKKIPRMKMKRRKMKMMNMKKKNVGEVRQK